jgi:cobalt/nickel transport system permease protein
MKPEYLDRDARRSSPLHRLPAALKLGAALLFVMITLAVPLALGWYFVAAGCAVLACNLISGIPFRSFFVRLLFLEPFVAGVCLLALFQHGGGETALRVFVRSNLSLSAMIILSNTTPFSALLDLLRRVRVPGLFVTTLSLLYRYLFVLMDQTERMSRARRSRTFHSRRWLAWRTGAGVAGQLFIRSTERAERVYAAMSARGWR